MKKEIIKILKSSIADGIDDNEVLLVKHFITKIQNLPNSFETEYQLQDFRSVQSSYFDETGKAYTGTIFNLDMAERMLKLINQLETELKNN